ncbi:MAG: hypothetical protein O7C56_03280, partial [Rickettsia endosymbiont of Ixodes persulcatus]|nr:hypothetical protein [Rickettsia endosymbiont of Ixodes persulcatus]
KVVENNNTQSSSNNDNSKKTPSNADNTNEPSKNTSSNTQTNSDETVTNDEQSDNKKPYNIDDPSPEAQKATKDGIAAADTVRATNPQEYDAEIARVDAGTSDVAHEPMLGQAEQSYRSHVDPE